MKTNALPVKLALVLSLVVLGSFGCKQAAPSTNREAAAANANTAKESVDPAVIEAELIKLERAWADAAKNHNFEAASKVLADDAIITYPDGTTGTKSEELRVIASGAITADSWDLLEPRVTLLDANAAVITGRTVIKNGKYKDPNGRTVDISGEYRFTDVYAKRNGVWQAVASQTTQIANPTAGASPTTTVSPSVPPPPAKSSPATSPAPAQATP
jgi:ketosteroid isomerase-like protein